MVLALLLYCVVVLAAYTIQEFLMQDQFNRRLALFYSRIVFELS